MLTKYLMAAGIKILGTDPDSIDIAEDRERFQKLLQQLKLKQPRMRWQRRSRMPMKLKLLDFQS